MTAHNYDGRRGAGGSLQDPSTRDLATRGVVITIAAGDAGASGLGLSPGLGLRLEAGTWAIFVARLVIGLRGRVVASAPSALEPTWPVDLVLSIGRGAAGWQEVIRCAARGTLVVRAADYLQAQLQLSTVAPGGWSATDVVALVATQLIAPILPGVESRTVLASGAGVATVNVVPGARTMQLLGADAPSATVQFWRSNQSIMANASTLDPAARLTIPTECASVVVSGLAPGAPVTATFETWQ